MHYLPEGIHELHKNDIQDNHSWQLNPMA